ncbi:unnamed protein product [Amoebophrya sp. A25]|nr:unnamed protein product [Amoebophrya sp. A25]|eukprot:GSA25T00025769001.1
MAPDYLGAPQPNHGSGGGGVSSSSNGNVRDRSPSETFRGGKWFAQNFGGGSIFNMYKRRSEQDVDLVNNQSSYFRFRRTSTASGEDAEAGTTGKTSAGASRDHGSPSRGTGGTRASKSSKAPGGIGAKRTNSGLLLSSLRSSIVNFYKQDSGHGNDDDDHGAHGQSNDSSSATKKGKPWFLRDEGHILYMAGDTVDTLASASPISVALQIILSVLIGLLVGAMWSLTLFASRVLPIWYEEWVVELDGTKGKADRKFTYYAMWMALATLVSGTAVALGRTLIPHIIADGFIATNVHMAICAGIPSEVIYLRGPLSAVYAGIGSVLDVEGPFRHVAGACGSALATFARARFPDQFSIDSFTTWILVGMASGVGCSFSNPIAGGVYAIETLVHMDMRKLNGCFILVGIAAISAGFSANLLTEYLGENVRTHYQYAWHSLAIPMPTDFTLGAKILGFVVGVGSGFISFAFSTCVNHVHLWCLERPGWNLCSQWRRGEEETGKVDPTEQQLREKIRREFFNVGTYASWTGYDPVPAKRPALHSGDSDSDMSSTTSSSGEPGGGVITKLLSCSCLCTRRCRRACSRHIIARVWEPIRSRIDTFCIYLWGPLIGFPVGLFTSGVAALAVYITTVQLSSGGRGSTGGVAPLLTFPGLFGGYDVVSHILTRYSCPEWALIEKDLSEAALNAQVAAQQREFFSSGGTTMIAAWSSTEGAAGNNYQLLTVNGMAQSSETCLEVGDYAIVFVAFFVNMVLATGIGGSGGTMLPSIVLGAAYGGFVMTVLEHIFPAEADSLRICTILGMVGVFASINNRMPVTGVLVIYFVSGLGKVGFVVNFTAPLLLCAMVSVLVSTFLEDRDWHVMWMGSEGLDADLVWRDGSSAVLGAKRALESSHDWSYLGAVAEAREQESRRDITRKVFHFIRAGETTKLHTLLITKKIDPSDIIFDESCQATATADAARLAAHMNMLTGGGAGPSTGLSDSTASAVMKRAMTRAGTAALMLEGTKTPAGEKIKRTLTSAYLKAQQKALAVWRIGTSGVVKRGSAYDGELSPGSSASRNRSGSRLTPLGYACKLRHEGIVHLLLQKKCAAGLESECESPMTIAVRNHLTESVARLLAYGARVDDSDALIEACQVYAVDALAQILDASAQAYTMFRGVEYSERERLANENERANREKESSKDQDNEAGPSGVSSKQLPTPTSHSSNSVRSRQLAASTDPGGLKARLESCYGVDFLSGGGCRDSSQSVAADDVPSIENGDSSRKVNGIFSFPKSWTTEAKEQKKVHRHTPTSPGMVDLAGVHLGIRNPTGLMKAPKRMSEDEAFEIASPSSSRGDDADDDRRRKLGNNNKGDGTYSNSLAEIKELVQMRADELALVPARPSDSNLGRQNSGSINGTGPSSGNLEFDPLITVLVAKYNLPTDILYIVKSHSDQEQSDIRDMLQAAVAKLDAKDFREKEDENAMVSSMSLAASTFNNSHTSGCIPRLPLHLYLVKHRNAKALKDFQQLPEAPVSIGDAAKTLRWYFEEQIGGDEYEEIYVKSGREEKLLKELKELKCALVWKGDFLCRVARSARLEIRAPPPDSASSGASARAIPDVHVNGHAKGMVIMERVPLLDPPEFARRGRGSMLDDPTGGSGNPVDFGAFAAGMNRDMGFAFAQKDTSKQGGGVGSSFDEKRKVAGFGAALSSHFLFGQAKKKGGPGGEPTGNWKHSKNRRSTSSGHLDDVLASGEGRVGGIRVEHGDSGSMATRARRMSFAKQGGRLGGSSGGSSAFVDTGLQGELEGIDLDGDNAANHFLTNGTTGGGNPNASLASIFAHAAVKGGKNRNGDPYGSDGAEEYDGTGELSIGSDQMLVEGKTYHWQPPEVSVPPRCTDEEVLRRVLKRLDLQHLGHNNAALVELFGSSGRVDSVKEYIFPTKVPESIDFQHDIILEDSDDETESEEEDEAGKKKKRKTSEDGAEDDDQKGGASSKKTTGSKGTSGSKESKNASDPSLGGKFVFSRAKTFTSYGNLDEAAIPKVTPLYDMDAIRKAEKCNNRKNRVTRKSLSDRQPVWAMPPAPLTAETRLQTLAQITHGYPANLHRQSQVDAANDGAETPPEGQSGDTPKAFLGVSMLAGVTPTPAWAATMKNSPKNSGGEGNRLQHINTIDGTGRSSSPSGNGRNATSGVAPRKSSADDVSGPSLSNGPTSAGPTPMTGKDKRGSFVSSSNVISGSTLTIESSSTTGKQGPRENKNRSNNKDLLLQEEDDEGIQVDDGTAGVSVLSNSTTDQEKAWKSSLNPERDLKAEVAIEREFPGLPLIKIVDTYVFPMKVTSSSPVVSADLGLPLLEPFLKKGVLFDWRRDQRVQPAAFSLGVTTIAKDRGARVGLSFSAIDPHGVAPGEQAPSVSLAAPPPTTGAAGLTHSSSGDKIASTVDPVSSSDFSTIRPTLSSGAVVISATGKNSTS